MFMEKDDILYGENGRKRIAENALVGLTLMIAESRTEEKDVMVVVNLINKTLFFFDSEKKIVISLKVAITIFSLVFYFFLFENY